MKEGKGRKGQQSKGMKVNGGRKEGKLRKEGRKEGWMEVI
jgi:hypothetical protein